MVALPSSLTPVKATYVRSGWRLLVVSAGSTETLTPIMSAPFGCMPSASGYHCDMIGVGPVAMSKSSWKPQRKLAYRSMRLMEVVNWNAPAPLPLKGSVADRIVELCGAKAPAKFRLLALGVKVRLSPASARRTPVRILRPRCSNEVGRNVGIRHLSGVGQVGPGGVGRVHPASSVQFVVKVNDAAIIFWFAPMKYARL